MNAKTDADLIFETYLYKHGRDDFIYEVALPGSSKVPDYQLPASPRPDLFEVKGFEPEPSPLGFGAFDPYPPVRNKIHKAKEKFKDLEDYSCSLVLHHSGPGLILLEPIIIFGSMLGDVGFQMPIDIGRDKLRDDRTRNVFTKGGRMVKYAKGGRPERPMNTTINGIVVIEHYAYGRRRFSKYLRAHEATIGRKVTFDELMEEMEKAEGSERDVSLVAIRAVVHENPYARIPLSSDLFIGPYDERYGANDMGAIVRLFAGAIVQEIGELPLI